MSNAPNSSGTTSHINGTVGKSSHCKLNEQLFRRNFNGQSVYSLLTIEFFCFGFFSFMFISVEGFPRKIVNKKRRKTNLLCHHHHINHSS